MASHPTTWYLPQLVLLPIKVWGETHIVSEHIVVYYYVNYLLLIKLEQKTFSLWRLFILNFSYWSSYIKQIANNRRDPKFSYLFIIFYTYIFFLLETPERQFDGVGISTG